MSDQDVPLAVSSPVSFQIGSCDTMRRKEKSCLVNEEAKAPSPDRIRRDRSWLRELIQRSQEGDTAAMEVLYEHFKRPLFSLIYRHTYHFQTAEDLLQDVFLKIFSHIKEINDFETFKAWSFRIALNSCYSYLRSKKRKLRETIPLDEVEGKIKENHDVHQRSMRKPLDEAIERLPHRLKSVFILHDVQGFKHKEISKMLGCSEGTSKSQLFKARMRIRAYLRDKQAI